MRKGIRGKKLSRTTNERKQLFRNLIRDMVKHGFMLTTLAKAKAVQPQLEKMVTTAKSGSLANLRKLIQETGDLETATKLLELGKLFASRPGGYTRIMRMVNRVGDNSHAVRFEWVEKLETVEVIEPEKPTQVKIQPELPKKTKVITKEKSKTKTQTKTKS